MVSTKRAFEGVGEDRDLSVRRLRVSCTRGMRSGEVESASAGAYLNQQAQDGDFGACYGVRGLESFGIRIDLGSNGLGELGNGHDGGNVAHIVEVEDVEETVLRLRRDPDPGATATHSVAVKVVQVCSRCCITLADVRGIEQQGHWVLKQVWSVSVMRGEPEKTY